MKTISFRNDILPLKNVLYRLALRITLNPAEAEDIVQDALIRVWNARERWPEIESIEAFCITTTRNIALDRLRRHDHNNPSLDEATTQQADQSANPYEQTLQKDRISLVKRLVDELPEKQKSCMQLRDFEGKSYKEVAEVMGISEEQVKVNIFRARQTIKKRFLETEQYGL